MAYRSISSREEVIKMSVQVGKQAPDFTAKAYHEGTAKDVRLSNYRGKWVMLCFYPANFTCV
jgi:peroxiredoxin (alkyl hydroperoxide reductase subunit C)